MDNTRKLHLYYSGLLSTAPDSVRQVLLKDISYEDDWGTLLEQATGIALGQQEIHFSAEYRPAKSIYSLIEREGFPPPSQPFYFSPSPLSLNRASFPAVDPKTDQDIEMVWTGFLTEVQQIAPDASLLDRAEMVLHLLHKHCSTIDCGYAKRETVSYYDLAKLRAGIAVALFGSSAEKEEENPSILLVGGDLSGIQDFIYEIVSKNAARNLKGRSFYLYLLANNILDSLVKKLDLFAGNIIFDSGGGFLLAAPNTAKTRSIISSFEDELADALFEQHKTTLFCALGKVPFQVGDSFSSKLGDLHQQFGEKKSRRFFSKVKAYAPLFDPLHVEEGGLNARDVITGEEIPEKELTDTWFFDPEDEEDLKRAKPDQQNAKLNLLKPLTAQQILLGQRLKGIDYWVKSDTPIDSLKKKQKGIDVQPLELGIYNYFLTREQLTSHWSQLEDKSIKLLQLNNFNWLDQSIPPQWQFGFHLYAGNQGPTVELNEKGEVPKTFSEMAGAIEDERKNKYVKDLEDLEKRFKRLGILRMDVDSLGYLFRKGLSDTQYCLANYSVLSRSMDFFFKGFLNTLWDCPDRRDNSQIIYAGGDDLFLVGRWDILLNFAREIKETFLAWTGHNPVMSISGGISIVTHKYPVMKAAKLAGDAEGSAKDNSFFPTETEKNNPLYEKNSFTLFGSPLRWQACGEGPLRWDDEFALVQDLRKRLSENLVSKQNRKGLPVSLLRRIMELDAMKKQAEKNGGNPSWRWQSAYVFSQMKSRLGKDKKYHHERLISELEQAVLFESYGEASNFGNHDFLTLLSIAARLTELDRRTHQDEKNNQPNHELTAINR